jgi:hypothetical protein
MHSKEQSNIFLDEFNNKMFNEMKLKMSKDEIEVSNYIDDIGPEVIFFKFEEIIENDKINP